MEDCFEEARHVFRVHTHPRGRRPMRAFSAPCAVALLFWLTILPQRLRIPDHSLDELLRAHDRNCAFIKNVRPACGDRGDRLMAAARRSAHGGQRRDSQATGDRLRILLLDPSGYIVTTRTGEGCAAGARWCCRPECRGSLDSSLSTRTTTSLSDMEASSEIDTRGHQSQAKLPALKLGLYRQLVPGRIVFASKSRRLRNTVTMGVVSAVARQRNRIHRMIYSRRCADHPGHSGGPLVEWGWRSGPVIDIPTLFFPSGGNEVRDSAIRACVLNCFLFGNCGVRYTCTALQLNRNPNDYAKACAALGRPQSYVVGGLPRLPAARKRTQGADRTLLERSRSG